MDASGAEGPAGPGRRLFVGRDEELTTVSACVAEVLVGRSRVVWVEGEAGSGKTGLVRAVLDGLPSPFRVLRAEADELAGDVSLDVVCQLGPLQAADGFGAGLELLEVFDAAQNGGPVAVVVEDLHWADVASRQALLTVARRLRHDKVLLLVTGRPEVRADGWERFVADPDRCVFVKLRGLSAGEVGELARRRGVRLDRWSAQRLHRHTQGHVLYVLTLLGELTEAQLASVEGALPAPRSLASTTIARMSDLPQEAQMLASALAVVNQRAALELVGRIGGVAEATVALDALLSTGFVEWWPEEVATPIEFVHPLYRTAVYEDLSPLLRRDLHRAAPATLDADRALVHRVAAAQRGDQTLVDEIAEAARRHEATGAASVAAGEWLWVASLSLGDDRVTHAILEAARLWLAAGQTHRAVGLRDRVKAGPACPARSLLLGMLDWEVGDAPNAERWFLDVVSLVGDGGLDGAVKASALARLARLYVTADRGAEGLEAATHALALAPDALEVEHLAWHALVLAEGRLRGAPAGLKRLAARIDPDPSKVSKEDADLLVTRGTAGFYAGQSRAGAADLRAAIRLARRGGVTAQLPRAHVQLAELLIVLGEWDEALVHGRLGLSLVLDDGQVWMEGQAHAALGSLLASRGDWHSADVQINAALRSAETTDTDEAWFTARVAESAAARARHDPAGVIAALAPLVDTAGSRSFTLLTSLRWWPVLVHALIDSGDTRLAVRHLRHLEKAAADRGLNFGARIEGLRAGLAAAQGHRDRAATGFARAVSLARPDDPMLDRASLHHDYGRLLRVMGDRSAAVAQLRAAHHLLNQAGAGPFRQRVDADLEAAGIRSRVTTYRSPLDLTEREQDVTALVGKGMTNQQVAAELYISKKAVEYHLRNIFAKRGITSRRQLHPDIR